MHEPTNARDSFSVGVGHDLFADVGRLFEQALVEKLAGVNGLAWESMPPLPGNAATPEVLDRYDAVLALGLRITEQSLRGIRRLLLVARWGVGYDRIDVAALTRCGVLLTITPHAVRGPVAEAILTLIFALAKNLLEQDRTVRRGGWRGQLSRLGKDIQGKTLGSLGLGNIAREMFRRASALGFVRFIAHDPYVEAQVASACGVEPVSREALFRESDFLVINCPLNHQTRGTVGEQELRWMKPTAYLINTARGGIVQQEALVRALRNNWIAGAGLDVFEREPPDPADPLLELDNVVLAPHGLAWTEELVRANTRQACESILAVASGRLPDHVVNREVLDSAAFRSKFRRLEAQPAV